MRVLVICYVNDTDYNMNFYIDFFMLVNYNVYYIKEGNEI